MVPEGSGHVGSQKRRLYFFVSLFVCFLRKEELQGNLSVSAGVHCGGTTSPLRICDHGSAFSQVGVPIYTTSSVWKNYCPSNLFGNLLIGVRGC